MSEIINNREQQTKSNTERLNILKQLFVDLHQGRNLDEVKAHFDALIGKVTIDEITQLQHDFVEEGSISAEELQHIYHRHSAIFQGAIEEDTPQNGRPEDQPGHPVHTFKLENQEIDKLLTTKLQVHFEEFMKDDSTDNIYNLMEDINLLLDIEKHYS
ncbi:DUF438 domain-containing protein, partial [Neobacillus drentensis]|uniref:DUF438 domain-containing protein n=1 Tax=Neobacillus drentensis TaxID=220684 RepID=UPI002FFF801A